MSLPKSMLNVADEIETYYSGSFVGVTPPYVVYVYPPNDEYAVRRELEILCHRLENSNVQPVIVSLAKLFWEAIDESGFAEDIVAEEKAHPNEAATLRQLHISIGQILQQPPTLTERVVQAVRESRAERPAVFLCRAGALYPCYRTSSLLDQLRHLLEVPTVLLYPGRLVGPYGLSFMGLCEPAHSYRARIIPREER